MPSEAELEDQALAMAEECEAIVYEMNDLIFGGIGEMFENATDFMLEKLAEMETK